MNQLKTQKQFINKLVMSKRLTILQKKNDANSLSFLRGLEVTIQGAENWIKSLNLKDIDKKELRDHLLNAISTRVSGNCEKEYGLYETETNVQQATFFNLFSFIKPSKQLKKDDNNEARVCSVSN